MLELEYSIVIPPDRRVHPQIRVLGSIFLGSGKGSGPTLMMPGWRCGRTGGDGDNIQNLRQTEKAD